MDGRGSAHPAVDVKYLSVSIIEEIHFQVDYILSSASFGDFSGSVTKKKSIKKHFSRTRSGFIWKLLEFGMWIRFFFVAGDDRMAETHFDARAH